MIKAFAIAYKTELLKIAHAPRSVNSILTSPDSLFSFLRRPECRVKHLKMQQSIYCPEEKKADQGRISAATMCGTASPTAAAIS